MKPIIIALALFLSLSVAAAEQPVGSKTDSVQHLIDELKCMDFPGSGTRHTF